MNLKTTVVLLLVLALAVGYMAAWNLGWFGLGAKQDSADDSRLNTTLLRDPPKVGDIVALRLDRPDRKTIAAEYKDGKWQLIEPAQLQAQSGPLDTAINMFTSLRILAVYQPGEHGAPSDVAAGLDQPRATLNITDKDGAQHTLIVGRLDPLSSRGRTFVRVNDDKNVYTVDADVLASLDLTAEKLRSLQIWDIAADQLRRLEIVSQTGTNVLTARDDAWTIQVLREKQEPFDAAADKSAVSKITSALTGLKAEQWVSEQPTDDDLALYGLTPAAATVKMTVNKVTPPATQPEEVAMAIDFGLVVDDGQYARVQGRRQVFKVAKSAVESLTVAGKDLRDKRLAPVGASDIVGLTLTGEEGRSFAFRKDSQPAAADTDDDDDEFSEKPATASRWQMTAPVATAADGRALDELIGKIVALKVESFDDEPSAARRQGLTKPRLKVELHRGEEKPSITLLIGPKSPLGATTLVGRADLPSVADLASSELAVLFVDPMTLAEKSVWKLAAEDVVGIEQVTAAGRRVVSRIAAGEPWQLAEPARMDADADAVRMLLDKFASLTATQQTLLTVAEAGLEKPDVTLTFTVLQAPAEGPADTQPEQPARKPVRRTLALADKDGVLYCQVDGKSAVYELDPSRLPEASAELAARGLISPGNRPDAAKADMLTLYSPQGEVVLDRAGQEWKLRQDATVPIDTIKVQEVVNSVGAISVVRYVDFDCTDPAKYGLDQPAARAGVRVEADDAAATQPDAADGRTVTLLVSAKGEEGSYYAMMTGSRRVGLVSPAELLKVQKTWEFFRKD